MKEKIDIEKLKRDKEIFEVPEGYFDKLPSMIQERIKEEESPDFSRAWAPRLAWAALAMILVIGFIVYNPFKENPTAEEILATVTTDEMIQFLDLEDISEEEILAYIDQADIADDLEFTDTEADILNELGDEDLDMLMDELDLNNGI